MPRFSRPGRKMDLQNMRDQSERGNELEKFLESVADDQPFLVLLGDDPAVDATIPAS